MGLFNLIKEKIFGHKAQAAPQAAGSSTAPAQAAPVAAPSPAAPPTPAATVDVGAVLASMAEMQGGGGNYQSSIVDLLKLLQLDSSLEARKELAAELSVSAGAPGSAEQNMALHQAVMRKLAENGGQVPDSFYH